MSLYERNLELLKENFRIRKFITTLEKVKWKNKLSDNSWSWKLSRNSTCSICHARKMEKWFKVEIFVLSLDPSKYFDTKIYHLWN